MYEIKQSTAITIPFFVHDADGDAVTGLSDGSFTKRISKGSAAFGAMTVTISEMENGWYSIPLSTSHSDTLGLLTIVFTNAGAKQVNLQWRVEAKLIDDLNDVAATDIVSAGAITTSSGAVSSVTTVATTTTNTDMRGTDSALLAASAPTNFSDLAITVTTGRVSVGTSFDKTGYSISGTITTLDGLNNFDPTTDAVANVTLVATTTTNTDMRGTDSALLAASAPTNFSDLAITVTTGQMTVGTNNDKTGYSISGTITTLDGLNDVAATDIVSAGAITTLSGAIVNVDLVDTTTTNTDMRGTDSALLAASAPTNFSDLAITITTGRVSVGTSFDKTGYSISGTITTLDGLNNFDPTTDDVANVTLTATTTTLTGHTPQTGDSFARIGANGAALTDLGGMSTGMKAEVNTEMVDVMDTDTITLPGQIAPPVTPTHRQAIGWLFKSYRNKETQTATEYSLFDDTGATVDAKATVSDDSTTFTKEEIGSGP